MRDTIAERPDHELDRTGTWVTNAVLFLGWLALLYPLFAFLATP